jgi:hypothetical protein
MRSMASVALCHAVGGSSCVASRVASLVMALGCAAFVCLDTGCRTCPQRRYVYDADDAVSEAIALIGRREVHDALGLTPEQRERVVALTSGPTPPALISLAQQANREWQAVSGLAAQDQEAAREDVLAKYMESLWEWTASGIEAALTGDQFHRYVQITLQVYGPSMILRYGQVATELGLLPEQLDELRRVAVRWDEQIQPLRRALGRYAIAGYTGVPSTDGKRDASPSEVSAQLVKAGRAKDSALLRSLTREQRRAWKRALGRPLRLTWDAESVYRLP